MVGQPSCIYNLLLAGSLAFGQVPTIAEEVVWGSPDSCHRVTVAASISTDRLRLRVPYSWYSHSFMYFIYIKMILVIIWPL